LGKLKTLFQFLDDHALIGNPKSSEEMEDSEEPKLGNILGDLCWKELSSVLVSEGLTQTIPTEFSQIQEYSSVAEEAVSLEAMLIQKGVNLLVIQMLNVKHD